MGKTPGQGSLVQYFNVPRRSRSSRTWRQRTSGLRTRSLASRARARPPSSSIGFGNQQSNLANRETTALRKGMDHELSNHVVNPDAKFAAALDVHATLSVAEFRFSVRFPEYL